MANTGGGDWGEALLASMCSEHGPAVSQPRWGSRQNDTQAHTNLNKSNARWSIPGGWAGSII